MSRVARLWVVLVGVAGVIVAALMQPYLLKLNEEALFPDLGDGTVVAGQGAFAGVVTTPAGSSWIYFGVLAVAVVLVVVGFVWGPRRALVGALLVLGGGSLVGATLREVAEDSDSLYPASPLPVTTALVASAAAIACGLVILVEAVRGRRTLQVSRRND